MPGHHGNHRSSHHSRSRAHHSSSSHYSSMQRSRTASSNTLNDSGGGLSNHRNTHQDIVATDRHHRESSTFCDWQEHKSSSGKVYYYNPRSGVSQWEVPLELRQQQMKSQPQQHQQRLASPESGLSESSSIRQQQENSPSSSTSSRHSTNSDSVSEDKPLLTPSLAYYFRPDMIADFKSSQQEELQNQTHQLDRETVLLNERLLKERVEISICKMDLEHATTQVEALETACAELKKTIEKFGIPNYQ